MGGSGGTILPSFRPDEFREKLRAAEQQTYDQEFESEIAKFLGLRLADFNSRDTEAIQRILDSVKQELSEEFEGPVSLLFGGSVAKHTYVDGLSDIDALLLMNPKDAVGQTPESLRELCGARLKERFGEQNVTVGDLAVTVMKDGQLLQFLPAIREGEHFKISNANGRGWAKVRPRVFAGMLTEANDRLGKKLVPTIKLAKAIISDFPENRRLTGYHTEALAVEMFRNYQGELTPKAMLRHFFDNAASNLMVPIKDATGQSTYVDEYLGEANSLERKIVADTCDRVARRIRNADGAKSMQLWKEIFGELA
jgi:hypothetical protein